MDKVTAKVISASERGREKGERSMQAYEKYFQVEKYLSEYLQCFMFQYFQMEHRPPLMTFR